MVSRSFRESFADPESRDRDVALEATSRKGVELLRILALSVRSEQDYGLTDRASARVGSVKPDATAEEVSAIIGTHVPPARARVGYRSLDLRQALNKVAHADPTATGFQADEAVHDLILTGTNRGDRWVAVVSVPRLCDAVESLPDRPVRAQ